MVSKYLSSLSKDEYLALTKKLWDIQNHQCFICEDKIDLDLNTPNIDHKLPLWKDPSMASTIFSGKKNYDYWKELFETGKSVDGALVLANPLNFIEMIKSGENNEGIM